ncbi:SDR family oxidoreductase [Paraburkholderia ferrariae]|jgi:hypothetical protein|uniref:hypothetical protein n=1 Tax=Paraburkholderia ferrariae TaxID=386056 RepID=UPI000489AAA9|nr:hypothetical protein [Paraburkholderia ferrariae]
MRCRWGTSLGYIDTPLLDTFFGDGKHDTLAAPVHRTHRPARDVAQAVRLLLTGGFIAAGEVLHRHGGARWA